MPTPQLKSLQAKQAKQEEQEDICLFAETNFRNQMRRFGIKLDDRRRHMYVIGKTGMGKTTMMENMVLHDIYAGHGVGLVDPHGDFAEKIIDYIPTNRINDVVYFNPSDRENPIGFNILEVKNEEQKHLVAAGLMAVFKKIWPDAWSSRMEYILNNTLLTLLDNQGSTLLGINRLLGDKTFRSEMVANLKDPVVKAFWEKEFAGYNDRYAAEAVAPIQNKIGQFLSATVIRNMVAQTKSTINIRELMDNKKIFIMNLSKGRIGEDNSRLLGGMLITQIQLSAMERVNIPEADRQDFFLYVDEFQNFATPSFANILSEARKYRLSLILAHQYVAQLDEVVADAVFGNVGTVVSFRVGAADAESMEKEFSPTFVIEDIVNLSKFQIFLKLMIDGVASQPFSAATMSPIGSPTGSYDKVLRVSRERYGTPRSDIEEKILRWSQPSEEELAQIERKKNKQQKKQPPKKIYPHTPIKKPQPNNKKQNYDNKQNKVEVKQPDRSKEETVSLKNLVLKNKEK
ncbi:MAG: type IV secretion system DNA-binding domain-containing protein [Candidatus Magasanikbacteria bacterium]|nr:type IV secretion system DNA-binding domain-containing protein [Candidatus Magasanikbacteria bacterium]